MRRASFRSCSLGILLLLALAVAACGTSTDDVAKARAEAKTVNGLCPVRQELVVPGLFVMHEDQKIGFCCPPCKDDFSADPETYMKLMRADREKFGYVGR